MNEFTFIFTAQSHMDQTTVNCLGLIDADDSGESSD